MGRSLAYGLLAGLFSAGLLLVGALGSLGGAVLSYLTALPLALVGLMFGVPAVLVATVAGAITAGSVNWLVGVEYLLGFGLPVAILVRQALLARPATEAGVASGDGALQWYTLGRLVAWLVGLASALVIIAALAASGEEGGLSGLLAPVVQMLLEQLQANRPELQGSADLEAMAGEIARRLPAVIAIGWMVLIGSNLALAQGLAARFGRNLRPSPRFAALTLPRGFGILVAVAAVLAFMPGQPGVIGAAILAAGGVAYFLQGLAVVHALARRTAVPGLVLVIVYTLVGLLGFPAILIVGLGLMEDWARIRRRFGGPGAGQEE